MDAAPSRGRGVSIQRVPDIEPRGTNRYASRADEHDRPIGTAYDQIGRVPLALRQCRLQLRAISCRSETVPLSGAEPDLIRVSGAHSVGYRAVPIDHG